MKRCDGCRVPDLPHRSSCSARLPSVEVRPSEFPHADGPFPCVGGEALKVPAPTYVDHHYDVWVAWVCSICRRFRYRLGTDGAIPLVEAV